MIQKNTSQHTRSQHTRSQYTAAPKQNYLPGFRSPRRFRSRPQPESLRQPEQSPDSDIAKEAQLLSYLRRNQGRPDKIINNAVEMLESELLEAHNFKHSRDEEHLKAWQNSEEMRQSDLFDLFESVEEFARRLENGDFFTGWGWDPELQRERAWGDIRWVDQMDRQLTQLNEAFQNGARAVCVVGYGRLLNLLIADPEAGYFCGTDHATNMISHDLDQIKARYLRSIYDSTPFEKRVTMLAKAMCQLVGLGEELGLQSLIAITSEPMDRLQDFVLEWIEVWRGSNSDSNQQTLFKSRQKLIGEFEWRALCQWHYQEAHQLTRGIDGLAWLARERGPKRPESYIQWLQALIKEKAWTAAAKAAKEATLRIENPLMKAYLCEVLAVICAEVGNCDDGQNALIKAFRVAPTPRRLANLLLALPESDRLHALRVEIDHCLVNADHFDDRTLSIMDFLGGRFEAALVRFQKAPVLGWSSDDHPGRLLLPAFLWLCRPDSDTNSIIKRIWRCIGRTIQSHAAEQQLRSIFHACGLSDEYWIDLARPDSTQLIASLIDPSKLKRERREALEATLQILVLGRVDKIVANQYRKAYDRAATAAVAIAELTATANTPKQFLVDLKTRFPRHRAFHRELKKLSELTPIPLQPFT